MPLTQQDFAPRVIGERPILALDFINNLYIGETIATASWSLSVLSGSDSQPGIRVVGTAGISGSVVSQLFDFATATIASGTRYLLECEIVTSLGETLIGVSHVIVNQAS
jgi:hypothetical protein